MTSRIKAMASASTVAPQERDLWCTNDEDWRFVVDVLGPDFADVAPPVNPDRRRAPRHYRNAFRVAWRGACYCNPPYSEILRWVERACRYRRQASTLFLLPVRTDSDWWERLGLEKALLFWPRRRRRFVRPWGGAATSPRFASVWVLVTAQNEIRNRFLDHALSRRGLVSLVLPPIAAPLPLSARGTLRRIGA